MEKSVDQGQTAWGPNILLDLIKVSTDKELFM